MTFCVRCKTDKNDDQFSPSELKEAGPWCRDCKNFNSRAKAAKARAEKEKIKKIEEEKKAALLAEGKKKCFECEVILDQSAYTEHQFNFKYGRCHNCLLDFNRINYQNHQEIRKQNALIYYYKSEELVNSEATLEEIIKIREERAKQKVKDREDKKPAQELRSLISAQIRKALTRTNGNKNGQSFLAALEYSSMDLKEHIEKQFSLPGNEWMNWDNRGTYHSNTWKDDDYNTWVWHLDHIIPQSDLPYTSMEEENFKKCWALENLRPYSAKQNVIDGANRTRHQKVG
jgi:hypothetical protein